MIVHYDQEEEYDNKKWELDAQMREAMKVLWGGKDNNALIAEIQKKLDDLSTERQEYYIEHVRHDRSKYDDKRMYFMSKHEDQYEVDVITLETKLKAAWEQKYGDRLHPERQAEKKQEEAKA